jgi:hypothetical protein
MGERMCPSSNANYQGAEKTRQRRSRIIQIFSGDPAASPLGGAHRPGAPYASHRAPQRVRFRSSLAAALLGKGESLGKEAVWADLGRAGEIVARVGWVRSLAFLSIL